MLMLDPASILMLEVSRGLLLRFQTGNARFNSREAVRRILDTTVENIQAFLRGEPSNVVNP